jgi:hypothetical protein
MSKEKIIPWYILFVFLVLFVFTLGTYTIDEPSFYVPVIIFSLFLGVSGVYLLGKDMDLLKNLYFLSYLMTIGIAFVPAIGSYMEDGNRFYGFPAQWFSHYHLRGSVSINLIGFLFDFFLFYFLLRFLNKIFLKSS